jgi:hypothetical protein
MSDDSRRAVFFFDVVVCSLSPDSEIDWFSKSIDA